LDWLTLIFHEPEQRTQLSQKNEELAKELDSALQQIKHGSARIQSLSTENRALISLAIGQGANIRTQSDLINQLEGQLRDQGHALEQAVSYQGQYERDAFTNSQEVARLEERMVTLTVESDMAQSASLLNRRHAQAREERLGIALHTIEMLLSETQTALRLSQESSLRQHDSLSYELETCAKQRDHRKAAAERFESKVLESERNMLNLRKELAIAYRSTREVKEQLETLTVALGEREATIRSLGRELADVRDQVQNAKYEIEGLREDLESVDAWKPSDSADGFGLTDELPPILEWRGWTTEGTPDAPAMFALPTQSQPRHTPGMSIEDFISAISSPSSQATPAPSNEILLCSTTHVIRSTELDDHFVVGYLLQPCSQPSRSSNTPRDVMASFATSQSYSNYMETIDELREQLADEQLNRAHIEDEVTLLQLKVLATEAVIVVQRRQLSSQQFQLFEETTKNASLCDESRSLMVERNAMAARIAVLEAGLVECLAEEMAAAKAADEAHAELAQAKEVLCAYVNEVDAVNMERDKLDMRLSQAMLLSFALQERVVALEQRIASAVVTPSDGSLT
jgi:chromosome segregation ATPase